MVAHTPSSLWDEAEERETFAFYCGRAKERKPGAISEMLSFVYDILPIDRYHRRHVASHQARRRGSRVFLFMPAKGSGRSNKIDWKALESSSIGEKLAPYLLTPRQSWTPAQRSSGARTFDKTKSTFFDRTYR
jgi:hypothetical protein